MEIVIEFPFVYESMQIQHRHNPGAVNILEVQVQIIISSRSRTECHMEGSVVEGASPIVYYSRQPLPLLTQESRHWHRKSENKHRKALWVIVLPTWSTWCIPFNYLIYKSKFKNLFDINMHDTFTENSNVAYCWNPHGICRVLAIFVFSIPFRLPAFGWFVPKNCDFHLILSSGKILGLMDIPYNDGI